MELPGLSILTAQIHLTSNKILHNNRLFAFLSLFYQADLKSIYLLSGFLRMKILILLTCQETIRIKVILRQLMDWIYLSDGNSLVIAEKQCWNFQYYWDMLLSDCFSAVSAVSTQLWNQKALLLIFICFRIDANEEDIEFGRVKKNGGRVSQNYFIFVLAHSKSSFALKILVEAKLLRLTDSKVDQSLCLSIILSWNSFGNLERLCEH